MSPGKFYAILLQGVGYTVFFGGVATIARVIHRLLPDGRWKRRLFTRIGD